MKEIKRLIDSSYENLCKGIVEIIKLEDNLNDNKLLESLVISKELFQIRQKLIKIREDIDKFSEKNIV